MQDRWSQGNRQKASRQRHARHVRVSDVSAACNNAEVLEQLCRRGVDLSAVDQDGATTLHYAAQLCSSQSPDSRQQTPGAGLSILRVLLSAGMDADCRDDDGRTPLMWAATSGSKHITPH